eukprot:3092762-Pleurochrysis_carterae.AAC.4
MPSRSMRALAGIALCTAAVVLFQRFSQGKQSLARVDVRPSQKLVAERVAADSLSRSLPVAEPQTNAWFAPRVRQMLSLPLLQDSIDARRNAPSVSCPHNCNGRGTCVPEMRSGPSTLVDRCLCKPGWSGLYCALLLALLLPNLMLSGCICRSQFPD